IKGIAFVGDSKISGEENGHLTAKETLKEIENSASVDEQLADQLLLPLAFSPPGSSYTFDKMYPHVKTNLEVIEIILGNVIQLDKLNENLYKLTRV
ncbi:MAG: RNA 3'-terminal phosphate cyclase, partial [Candidatus Heimdallarchaeota archaeon]